MAEGEGFEPPIPCGIPVFKTGAFNQTRPPLRARYRLASMRSRPPIYGCTTFGIVTDPSAS
jgi:hypothetical protein